ncbi:AAA ATPase [Sparganum proliferum]
MLRRGKAADDDEEDLFKLTIGVIISVFVSDNFNLFSLRCISVSSGETQQRHLPQNYQVISIVDKTNSTSIKEKRLLLGCNLTNKDDRPFPIRRDSLPAAVLEDTRPSHGSSSVTELSTKRRSPAKKGTKNDSKQVVDTPKFSLSQALHTGELDKVIGREKEIGFLRKLLEDCISQKKSASLYISGAPGTGKTATVTQEVQTLVTDGRCQAIFINCMQLQTPKAVFTCILSQLNASSSGYSSSSSVENVVTAVEVCLTKKSRRLPLIIVLDEIDQLATSYQDVLYTVFGWPDGLPDSHLILLGIANALDLTERLLPGLQSRSFRPLHLAFPPYSKDQISEIISDRLLRQGNSSGSSAQALDKLAIQFCAKKVAACSGDVRTALAVCHRAIELARLEARAKQQVAGGDEDVENTPPLQRRLLSSPALRAAPETFVVPTLRHVSQALQEAQSGGELSTRRLSLLHSTTTTDDPQSAPQPSSARNNMPLHHKLVLATALLLRRLRGIREVAVGQLYDLYTHVCSLRKLVALEMSEFASVCDLLDSHGLLRVITPGSRAAASCTPARMKRVSLLLDDKGVERSLDDNLLLTSVLSIRSIP